MTHKYVSNAKILRFAVLLGLLGLTISIHAWYCANTFAVAAAIAGDAITTEWMTTPTTNVSTNVILVNDIYEAGHLNDEINTEKLCPNQGSDLKLIIFISSEPSHAEARLSIRQTWGHYGMRRDVGIAFMLGRGANHSLNAKMSEENYIYGDLIRGNFVDSYRNLTLKSISMLEWVVNHCSRARFLLKTDDDMFINVPALLNFLDKRASERHIIYGRLITENFPLREKQSKFYVATVQFGPTRFPPFTMGAAYVLPNDIMHDLYVNSLQQVYLNLEDVFLTGIVARQLNIKRVDVYEFLNDRILFHPCTLRRAISLHRIEPNEQIDFWKMLLDKSFKCK